MSRRARAGSTSGGLVLLPTGTPSASWVTRFSQDFEDGSVSSAVTTGTTGFIRSNITTGGLIIAGTRSMRFGCTGGTPPIAVWDFNSTWLNNASKDIKRFRATVKVRAETGTTTVRVGVRQNIADFTFSQAELAVVTTTPTTFTHDFIWNFSGGGTLRVEMIDVTTIIIDDVLLEEDVNFTGFLPADSGLIPTDFMGVHFNQASVGGHENAPDLNYKLVRAFGLGTWRFAQTTEGGAFSWTDIDAEATECLNHGASYMHNCAWPPLWATDGVETGGPPYPGSNRLPDATHIDDCVAFLNAAYARVEGIAPGAFKYVEIWNETDQLQMYSQTVAAMVTFAEAIYNAAKALNPNIIVIAPNVSYLGMDFLDDFLRAGGDAFVDAYSIHLYSSLTTNRGMIAFAYNMRQTLNRWSVASTKPIHNTEGSLPAGPTGTPEELARAVIAMAMAGIKSFSWYTLEGIYTIDGDGPSQTALAVEPTYAVNTQLGDVYERVCSWLAGHTITGAFARDGMFHVVLTRPAAAGTRVLVWSTGGSARVKGSAAWGITRALNIHGVDVAVSFDGSDPIVEAGYTPIMMDNGT